MTDDAFAKRNFRVSYYDKVGCRGVGEKALVTILKDDVIDRKKLENFCVRYPVPPSFRLLIWKILLDVLPVHQHAHKFVMQQRIEQYNDLHSALKAMRRINDASDVACTCLKMFLLETGEMNLRPGRESWHSTFIAMAAAANEIFDSPVEAYWITVKFYHFFKTSNIGAPQDEYNNIMLNTIEKEHSKLFYLLIDFDIFSREFTKSWFSSCFAGILSCDGCVEKVWDVTLGRGGRILPYVAAHVFLAFDRQLLQSKTQTDCFEVLKKTPFSEDVSNVIVRRAIESWKKYEKII